MPTFQNPPVYVWASVRAEVHTHLRMADVSCFYVSDQTLLACMSLVIISVLWTTASAEILLIHHFPFT